MTVKNSFASGALLSGYDELFFSCFAFYRSFRNTAGYTLIITVSALTVTVPAAFACMQLKGRAMDIFFAAMIMLMMMPLQVTLLPNYIGLRDMDMLDSPAAVVIPAVFSPIYAVILIQYMRGIDTSVIEAARLETSSAARIIFSAVLPQIRPCVFAVTLLAAAESWNMTEQPMYFLKSEEYMPLTIFMSSAAEWENILYPAAVISMLPMLILYGYFGNELKNGISFGGTYE